MMKYILLSLCLIFAGLRGTSGICTTFSNCAERIDGGLCHLVSRGNAGWQWNIQGDSYVNGANILLYWSGATLVNNNFVPVMTDYDSSGCPTSYRFKTRVNVGAAKCVGYRNGDWIQGNTFVQWDCFEPGQDFQINCQSYALGSCKRCKIEKRGSDGTYCVMPPINWPGGLIIDRCDRWSNGFIWDIYCTGSNLN